MGTVYRALQLSLDRTVALKVLAPRLAADEAFIKRFLGEARAAAILALADAGLEVAEYAPAMVKQTVAGFGRGEKGQVARMVAFQLGLPKPPSPEDAADALAVAITHWAHGRLAGLARR